MTEVKPAALSLGELREHMVRLGFSSATRLTRAGMLRVLERYPDGLRSKGRIK